MEPTLAYVHSDAGGYAFATYFIRALSWSIATNDSWLLRALGGPNCSACKRYTDGIERLHRTGETQIGGRPSIITSHRLFGSMPGGAEVAIEYVVSESAATLLPTRQTTPPHSKANSIVYLIWDLDRWLVNEVAAP